MIKQSQSWIIPGQINENLLHEHLRFCSNLIKTFFKINDENKQDFGFLSFSVLDLFTLKVWDSSDCGGTGIIFEHF